MKMLIDDLLEYIQPSTMICICIHNSDGVYQHRINPMPAGICILEKTKYWNVLNIIHKNNYIEIGVYHKD